LDRIDIHIEVPRVDYDKLSQQRLGESSITIRSRVEIARKMQLSRFNGRTNNSEDHESVKFLSNNAEMGPSEIRKHCVLDEASNNLMRSAMRQLQLSARAYHRILKLSRTIADLADSPSISPNHIAEALQYRPKLNLEA
jgi:magnesium chelatase family protein